MKRIISLLLAAMLAMATLAVPAATGGLIYDGTFTGGKVPGNGVTAALLTEKGVAVYTENETDIL